MRRYVRSAFWLFTSKEPSDGSTRLANTLSRVDLPAPLCKHTQMNCHTSVTHSKHPTVPCSHHSNEFTWLHQPSCAVQNALLPSVFGCSLATLLLGGIVFINNIKTEVLIFKSDWLERAKMLQPRLSLERGRVFLRRGFDFNLVNCKTTEH